MDLKDVKIGVLGGGVSPERDISLISAKEAQNALLRAGLEAIFVDITSSLLSDVKKLITSYGLDLAFIALHGKFGEDGSIQQILEDLGIPYTGSGPKASFLAMDKTLSKNLFIKSGIQTPNFRVCVNCESLPKDIKYPVVIKPDFSGSSLGISIVREEFDLKKALDKAFYYSRSEVIFEEYIKGRELTVGILEDKPLSVIEIVSKNSYYDFDAKYVDAKTDFIAPAQLENGLYKKVQNQALKAYQILGCRYFSRVDFRLNTSNIPYVLEVNSIPGLTSHSLLPLSAKKCGIGFDALILKMVRLTLYAKKEKQKTQKN